MDRSLSHTVKLQGVCRRLKGEMYKELRLSPLFHFSCPVCHVLHV
uniref:Uncharacterized protein n=1 Tax=Anguilla anguilla TaxID=7936 RepID=A0A0E9UKP5_ANGAN